MSFDIAIVGLANRFPEAPSPAALWGLLQEGRTSFRRLDASAMRACGVPEEQLAADNFVPVVSMLEPEWIESFDAAFFGIPAREAALLDPQHRLFLECAWEALEDAGYDPNGKENGDIGVFAGASLNAYWIRNLSCNPLSLTTSSGFLSLVANEKDYLASRIAYKLDLRGPAVTVQTACSTSLVAVHLAMQSLVFGECEMALAGGVSVKVPQEAGYLYQDGLPFSRDGTCRSFDAAGNGTVFGSGAGVVLLKPLEAALDERDDIYAVIRASACNNDGNRKVGFTAPSVDGQADAIRRAALLADIDPAAISYVEAHATATPLGDPIEAMALAQALGEARARPCRIGSIKSNIGHMETAAGIAGLIKTALMLKHRRLVPSARFETPNSHIDFASAGLQVQTLSEPWETHDGTPRLAGVSSFGMGGTNVHMILEEAPISAAPAAPDPSARRHHVMVLSAKSDAALTQMACRLGAWIDAHPATDPATLAACLQTRRAHLSVRHAFVASTLAEATARLEGKGSGEAFFGYCPETPPKTAFVYCGGGAQYPAMMAGLLANEPVFRAAVASCAEQFAPLIGLDLQGYLAARHAGDTQMAGRMQRADIAFPALFTVQHAMGELLESWGVMPQVVMGHSNGEFAAAVRAGVMDLATAIKLVATRSVLLAKMPAGGLLAVSADATSVADIAARCELSIAASNSPTNTALSGPLDRLDQAEALILDELGLECRRIHLAAAVHSQMTESIVEPFAEVVARQHFQAPRVRWISTVTGTDMDPIRAPDTRYWVDHLRRTVRFKDALETLLAGPPVALLDMGPNRVVGDLLRQNAAGRSLSIIQWARSHAETLPDEVVAHQALAKTWTLGACVDWMRYNNAQRPPKLDLPSYPWQRQRYWIDPPSTGPAAVDHIDRRMADLTQPEPAPAADHRPAMTSRYTAPATDTETKVLAIWQRFFGGRTIGTTDDFIELGGTSLLATELLEAVNRELGVTLGLTTFLESKNVATVARAIDELIDEREARFLAEALAEIAGKSDDQLQAIADDA
jgi:acyl transferase domain-containing protein